MKTLKRIAWKFLKVILVFNLILLFSCDDPDEFNLGETITIDFNESAILYESLQQIEIKFTKLVNESRCPPDSQCSEAGDATVEIQVNSDTTFNLVTCLNKPNCSSEYIAHFDGFDIELISVDFGADRNYGEESKYSIDIVVNRSIVFLD